MYKKNKIPDDFEESSIQLDDALKRSGNNLKQAVKDFASDVDGTVLLEINGAIDKAQVSGFSSQDKQKLRQHFLPLAQKLKIDQLKNLAELKVYVAKTWLEQVETDQKDKASTFARSIGLDKGQVDFSDVIPNTAQSFEYTSSARRKGLLLVASIMQKLAK